MKIKDIRSMTNDELNAKLVATKTELFNLRFQHATGNLANPMLLNSLKKTLQKSKLFLTKENLAKMSSPTKRLRHRSERDGRKKK